MPSVTLPNAVYWLSRCWQWSRPRQMKNWLPAEFGSCERAIESTPSWCSRSLNSASTFQPGPPMPVPSGTSALDHEAGNDSVKNHPIIKSILRQFLEVFRVFWRHIVPKFDGDGALVCFDCCCWICHGAKGYHTESGWGLFHTTQYIRVLLGYRNGGRIAIP